MKRTGKMKKFNFKMAIEELKREMIKLPKIDPKNYSKGQGIQWNTWWEHWHTISEEVYKATASEQFKQFRLELKEAFIREGYKVYGFNYDDLSSLLLEFPYYYDQYIKNPNNLTKEDYTHIANKILHWWEWTYLGLLAKEGEEDV